MIKFLNGLTSYWGSDTPQEVWWSLNDLIYFAKSIGFQTDKYFNDPLDFSTDEADSIVESNELLKIELAKFFEEKLK
jgi:hypothetical protein